MVSTSFYTSAKMKMIEHDKDNGKDTEWKEIEHINDADISMIQT